jgi:uncharacterized RDD family membrane protein YckC
MVLCPSCGAENADGMKFCVKCGATISDSAHAAGSWQQPSGNLYDTPSAGSSSFGGSQPGSYSPPSVPPSAYSYPQGMGGPSGMNYALWGDRVLAALIDGALVFAVVVVLYIVIGIIGGVASGIAGSVSEDLGGLVGSTFCCTFIILPMISMLGVGLYNKVYLITKRGSSIGQNFMKLKVVDGGGNLLQTGTAVLRLLVQMGLGLIPFIGWVLVLLDLLFPLWDPQRQTLHDKAVGSYVVKEG